MSNLERAATEYIEICHEKQKSGACDVKSIAQTLAEKYDVECYDILIKSMSLNLKIMKK